MQAKQTDLAAAEAHVSKLVQELEQRQAESAAAVSAAEDRCRDLEAVVSQVLSSHLLKWNQHALSHPLSSTWPAGASVYQSSFRVEISLLGRVSLLGERYYHNAKIHARVDKSLCTSSSLGTTSFDSCPWQWQASHA